MSAAGFYVKSHEADYDGVDITIASSADYETYYCPDFELQLKCTSQVEVLYPRHLSWQMDASAFRKLTNPKRYGDAVLGVLLVPSEPEPLLEVDESELLTRSRMYWQWASRLGTVADGQASKTVHLPRENLFDVEQLQGIMKTIGEGGDR